jgi:hypothetical protein
VSSLADGAGAGAFHFNSGTFNLTGDDLIIGTGGLFGSTVQVSTGQVFNVIHTTTVAGDGLLYLDGGAFSAGNLVNNGQVAIDGRCSRISAA